MAGVACMISRTGYTGEDGFELYFAAERAVKVWEALAEVGTPLGMVPVGLGAPGHPAPGSAADSLRQ